MAFSCVSDRGNDMETYGGPQVSRQNYESRQNKVNSRQNTTTHELTAELTAERSELTAEHNELTAEPRDKATAEVEIHGGSRNLP